MKKFCLFLLFLALSNGLFAQKKEQRSAVLSVLQYQISGFQQLEFETTDSVGSLGVLAAAGADFSEAYFLIGDKKYPLQEDIHLRSEENSASVLCILDKKIIGKVQFFSGRLSGKTEFHLINVPKITLKKNNFPPASRTENFEKPKVISQNEWSAGLEMVSYSPARTTVTHLIVHHTAGSNTDKDYLNVVRNIYIYHTQTNKWSNVGYNFLIAQDGTIFEGRDGEGEFEGDNERGAHFCGKNSNTMGVSLLGNYEGNQQPTEETLKSLKDLLAWKLEKEKLDPTGQSLHSGSMLKTISGHRDGCSTDCPGANMYAKLETVRQEIKTMFKVLATENTEDNGLKIYPQPAAGLLFIESPDQPISAYYLSDLNGKVLKTEAFSSGEFSVSADVSGLSSGLYLLKIKTKNSFILQKVVLNN